MNMGPFAWFKWQALFESLPLFFRGLGYTFIISIAALALALVLGVIFGLMSETNFKPLRIISRIYVEFFQNTPLLIQVFFLYNGLPLLGIMLSITSIGIFGVGLYTGAYVTEVVRAGISSVSRGQREAGLSQGFTYTQVMLEIILPQAVRFMLPPLTNQAVNLIKNTSVVAVISGVDIMFTAKSWSGWNQYYGPAFVAAGLLYFILCFPLAKLATHFENKMRVSQGGAANG
jgi:putative glutamine transport system permease protein